MSKRSKPAERPVAYVILRNGKRIVYSVPGNLYETRVLAWALPGDLDRVRQWWCKRYPRSRITAVPVLAFEVGGAR